MPHPTENDPRPTENDGDVTVRTVTGHDILPYLPDLARLRISVFRDWPYIYDGDVAHEEQYLQTYVQAPGAAIIIAAADQKIVGAATCLPMPAATPNIQLPFIDCGWDVSKIFYFGESVLLKAYRGRGIGVKFFSQREAQAAGFETATFCARAASRGAPPARPGLHDRWTVSGRIAATASTSNSPAG